MSNQACLNEHMSWEMKKSFRQLQMSSLKKNAKENQVLK